jgi:gas vesicle protein
VPVGVLFAPKSGAETREFLRNKAEEGIDSVKEQAGSLKETAAEALERSKQTIQKHKDNLASALEAGKQAYREATTTFGRLRVLEDALTRANTQLAHTKVVLDDTISRALETVAVVQTGIMKPLPEIQGVAAGVRTAIVYLMRGGRPSPAQAADDEK